MAIILIIHSKPAVGTNNGHRTKHTVLYLISATSQNKDRQLGSVQKQRGAMRFAAWLLRTISLAKVLCNIAEPIQTRHTWFQLLKNRVFIIWDLQLFQQFHETSLLELKKGTVCFWSLSWPLPHGAEWCRMGGRFAATNGLQRVVFLNYIVNM